MSLANYALLVICYIRDVFVNLFILCQRKLSGNSGRVFSDDEIAFQAQYLCEKYMEQQFAQNEKYMSVYRTSSRSSEEGYEVAVRTMNKFGRILEKGFPWLYTDVVQQLNFRINFEIVICGLFECVSDNIMIEGVTWAKIVSMYAFAGALAKDCCQAKKYKTARNISIWMGQYTRKKLARWIGSHGGWDGFVLHFGESPFCPATRYKWFEMIISAATILATTTLPIIIFKSMSIH